MTDKHKISSDTNKTEADKSKPKEDPKETTSFDKKFGVLSSIRRTNVEKRGGKK